MLGSRRALAAIVLAVGLFGAGCGGADYTRRASAEPNGNGADASTPVTRSDTLSATLFRAVSVTRTARTARTSISVTVTGLGSDTLTIGALATGAFDIAGSGVVDLRNGDAELSLSVPLFDRLGRGGAIEQRIVGGVVYTKIPAEILKGVGLPASVNWLSLDLEHPRGAEPEALSQSQVDPAGQLVFVSEASGEIRAIGSESVRGVPATHYTATIDPAGDPRGGTGANVLKARMARLGWAVGGRRLGIDVWIDRGLRIRRVVVSIPLSKAVGARQPMGPDATLRIQSDFYAFGAPVRVAVPPRPAVRPYRVLRTGVASS